MQSSAFTPVLLPEQPVAPAERTDAQAISEVIGGNTEMFEVIVRRYNTQLYRVGMAYLRNHAQTEDAMQNAYLKAFVNLSGFKGGSAFATWLTRIMINECLMILRAQKRFRAESLMDETLPPHPELMAPPMPDPLHAQELKQLLEQSIALLPRAHRAVYILREIQHLSTDETAESLGLSRANVKVCLHRAREGLKAQLLKNASGLELFDYPAAFCDPMTSRVMQAVRSGPGPTA